MNFKVNFHEPYRSHQCNLSVIKLLNNKKSSLFGFDKITKKNENIIKKKFGFKNILFTNSCTSSLEISALLLYRKNKNEAIIPSYTFSTTASSFLRSNFKVKFIDVVDQSMMPSFENIKKNVSKKTGVIVIVHYAGLPIDDLEKLKSFCKKRKIYLVEDAAQALGSYYKKEMLGKFGDLSCFSFHETKNIHSGSGGMLVVNNRKFLKKAHFILERGTDRRLVLQKIKSKYSWVTLGSSFNMTELNSSYLTHQLLVYNKIINDRKKIYNKYLSFINSKLFEKYFYFNKNKYKFNYHSLFIVLKKHSANNFINFLKKNKIQAFIGYVPLHNSPFGKTINSRKLINTEFFSKRVVRLPIHNNIKLKDIEYIKKIFEKFFIKK